MVYTVVHEGLRLKDDTRGHKNEVCEEIKWLVELNLKKEINISKRKYCLNYRGRSVTLSITIIFVRMI